MGNQNINVQTLACLADLQFWAATQGAHKSAAGLQAGKVKNISIKNNYIANGTYGNWVSMLQDRCMDLNAAISLRDSLSAAGDVSGLVANFALVPAEVICLDFDDVGETLADEWLTWLRGAAIERSSSGKGFHAFFRVPKTFAARIKGDRGEHRGFPFGMDDETGAAKRIDVFCGGVNRWVTVTGDSVNDWSALGGIELCEAGLKMLEQAFEAQGFFQTEANEREQRTKVGSRSAGTEDAEEVGITDAAEVIRLMRQNSGFRTTNGKYVQGGLCRLMDGDAEAVGSFYGGDWSAADLGLAREVTYYTQDYDVVLKVMLACGLTKREAYTGRNDENKYKWSRDDYAASTVDKALAWREGQARYQDKTKGSAALPNAVGGLTDGLQRTSYGDKLIVKQVGRGRNARLEPVACLHNAVAVLEHDERFKGVFGFDELQFSAAAVKPLEGVNASRFPLDRVEKLHIGVVQCELDKLGIIFNGGGSRMVEQAINQVAADYRFNPLQQRIEEAEPWDNADRYTVEFICRELFEFDVSHFPQEERAELVELQCKLFRYWMRQVAARAMQTGCKAEGFLLLEGEQHIGKGRMVNLLANWWDKEAWDKVKVGTIDDSVNIVGKRLLPMPKETLADFNSRDAGLRIRGKLFFFVDEMKDFDARHTELLKQIISQQLDNTRSMQANFGDDVLRLGCFVGALNAGQDLVSAARILSDSTGNRRWWVLRLKSVNYGRLYELTEQLWAQAIHEHKEGLSHFLSVDEMQLNNRWLRQFQPYDAWADLVEEVYMDGDFMKVHWKYGFSVEGVWCDGGFTTDELSNWMLGRDVTKTKAIGLRSTDREPTTAAVRKVVGKALEMLGFVKKSTQRTRGSGRSGTDNIWVRVLAETEVLERGLGLWELGASCEAER